MKEQEARSAGQRVRAGRGDQPLRHPVVDVAEALEAPFFVLDDVEEGAAIELHVGEVLEETLSRHTVIEDPTLDDVLAACAWAQDEALRLYGEPAAARERNSE